VKADIGTSITSIAVRLATLYRNGIMPNISHECFHIHKMSRTSIDIAAQALMNLKTAFGREQSSQMSGRLWA
jgi:hypothetical protein